MKLKIDPKYGNIDADSLMFLRHFDDFSTSEICEVGANEEDTADILIDNRYHNVIGIDLRSRVGTKYTHLVGDFVQAWWLSRCHVFYSLSAIEHFGLGCYGQAFRDESYDVKAMQRMYDLLWLNGSCYITVPYGKQFCVEPDWRVYDAKALQERIIGKFHVEKKLFFQSGDCPGLRVDHNDDGILMVTEEDADTFHAPTHPHLTCFLKMRKI